MSYKNIILQFKLVLLLSIIFKISYVSANLTSQKPHAPIGIMGDHMHKKGEWMFSYRKMQMDMKNTQNRNMSTEMDMIGAMYAPNDDVTLMIMTNYLKKTMDPMNMGNMGNMGNMRNNGLGDTKISTLLSLSSHGYNNLHINLGVSIPTGNVEENMSYSMQLGSGTYDLETGITYNGQGNKLYWGGQIKTITRIDGSEDYKFGNQYSLNAWGMHLISNKSYGSLRLGYTEWKSINGEGSTLEAASMMAPPNSANSGGYRTVLSLGLNFLNFENQQIGIEYSTILDEKLSQGQMEMQDMLTVGYQIALK